MKNYYYARTHDQISTAVIDMFNDMVVYRYDPVTGDIINTIAVPVTFAPTEKIYQFRKEQESGKTYFLSLPRIAIVYGGIAQAPQRATSINTERFFIADSGEFATTGFTDFQPVPCDYIFTVHIKAEMFADYSQIIENIVPYFAPDSTSLRVREFSFLNLERNLKVSMTSVSADINPSLDDQSMREFNANFTLTVEGYSYRPVLAGSGLIESIDIKYFMGDAINWFNNIIITGYETSAAMPATSSYSTSGVNNDGNYYTITDIEGT
jgi:hypothetical protein